MSTTLRAEEDMGGLRNELRSGWRNLLGAALGIALGFGSYTLVSSLFFRALEGQFGCSKSAVAASLFALPLTGMVLPLAGGLADRFGVRRGSLALGHSHERQLVRAHSPARRLRTMPVDPRKIK